MLMASEADNGNLNGTQSDLLATWLVGVLHKALIILHLDELRRRRTRRRTPATGAG